MWFLEGNMDFFFFETNVMFWILELHDISPLIYASRFFKINTIFSSSQTRLRVSGMALWGWRVENLGVLQIMRTFAVLQMCWCSKSPDTQGRRPHMHACLSQPLLCPFTVSSLDFLMGVFSCGNHTCPLGKCLRPLASATPNAFP